MQWVTNHDTVMDALKKSKYVVKVIKELFDDDVTRDRDKGPIFFAQDSNKSLEKFFYEVNPDDLRDQAKRDVENDT